jgi:hypothetical protein
MIDVKTNAETKSKRTRRRARGVSRPATARCTKYVVLYRREGGARSAPPLGTWALGRRAPGGLGAAATACQSPPSPPSPPLFAISDWQAEVPQQVRISMRQRCRRCMYGVLRTSIHQSRGATWHAQSCPPSVEFASSGTTIAAHSGACHSCASGASMKHRCPSYMCGVQYRTCTSIYSTCGVDYTRRCNRRRASSES